MLPAVATLIPLYVFLNQFRIEAFGFDFNLRASLLGVMLAIISAPLPFAIWNLKGYLDTIPHDLEEAAFVDGATQNQTFTQDHPAAGHAGHRGHRLPGLPGWLDRVPDGLHVHRRQRARLDAVASRSTAWSASSRGTRPWSEFAAFAILFALPVSIVFFIFQRYLVGGLAVGGVKG